MTTQPLPTNPIRIPNLPVGKLIDENGMPTDEELLFRQQLITALQTLIGPEGLVAPSQTAANITAIATNTQDTPAGNEYTVEFGTILYESDTQTMKVIISDGNPTPAPVIKTFTLV